MFFGLFGEDLKKNHARVMTVCDPPPGGGPKSYDSIRGSSLRVILRSFFIISTSSEHPKIILAIQKHFKSIRNCIIDLRIWYYDHSRRQTADFQKTPLLGGVKKNSQMVIFEKSCSLSIAQLTIWKRAYHEKVELFNFSCAPETAKSVTIYSTRV